MRKHYEYAVSGTDAQGAPWTTQGKVESEFAEVFDAAIREAFAALTQGKAIYGKPGQGGCAGPYDVDTVVIKRVRQ